MIKIAICRKDPYGDALSLLLKQTDGFDVLGTFEDANVALKNLHVRPDVFLVDFADPVGKTFANILQVKTGETSPKVIMLTDNEDMESIIRCVKVGIDGYLLRKSSLMTLRDSILEAYSGGFPMSPTIARKLIGTFSPGSEDLTISILLTPREKEVLEMLVEGMSYKLISANLGIAINTVRSHIKKVYEKLRVNSKSEAVSKALRHHLI